MGGMQELVLDLLEHIGKQRLLALLPRLYNRTLWVSLPCHVFTGRNHKSFIHNDAVK